MITIDQFTQKSGFTARDTFAACKMYKGQLKTEEEWNKILSKDFTFKPFIKPITKDKNVKNAEKVKEPVKTEKPKRVYNRIKK
jgi:hypothetical protein